MTRNVVWRLPQKSAIQIYVSIKYRECRYVVILMVPVMVNMLCVVVVARLLLLMISNQVKY